MGPTPQVPSIAPVSQASSGPGEDISTVLGQVAAQVQQPLPPQYIQGTSIAQPRVQPIVPYTPQNDQRQPLNNQATSLKQARTQNAFASLANMVGKAGNALQERKQNLLKEDLKTVMTAKENVANAQAVLQQDPNNAMAKKVLDANKKQLESILTDPKKQKQLAKALDISFIDMDKNKTPEVKAYQAAAKEVKEAGQYVSNNPAEAKIAAQAAGASGGSQQTQQQQSATPHADVAIAKDLPNIQVNPQYVEAKKTQDAAQKQLTQYVLPRLITAESQKQIQAVKDGNAAARLQYKTVTDFNKEAMRLSENAKLQSQKAKDAMALQIRRDSDAMARTVTEVNARLKIATDKRLDPANVTKLKAEALDKVDQALKAITAERMSLSTQLQNAKTDEEKAVLNNLLSYNELKAKATNEYRQKVATDVYGRVSEGLYDRSGGTGSNKQITGADLSDEPDDDDEDENSDNF